MRPAAVLAVMWILLWPAQATGWSGPAGRDGRGGEALQSARPLPETQPSRSRWLLRRNQPYAVNPALIRVHDGDTFSVAWATIRIRGIDAPELGRPRAAAATRRLTELLRSGPVVVVPRAEDVYGRVVADVHVGGTSVGDVLRREGHATRWPRSRQRGRGARSANIGHP